MLVVYLDIYALITEGSLTLLFYMWRFSPKFRAVGSSQAMTSPVLVAQFLIVAKMNLKVVYLCLNFILVLVTIFLIYLTAVHKNYGPY